VVFINKQDWSGPVSRLLSAMAKRQIGWSLLSFGKMVKIVKIF
jgi:hypothetical protein